MRNADDKNQGSEFRGAIQQREPALLMRVDWWNRMEIDMVSRQKWTFTGVVISYNLLRNLLFYALASNLRFLETTISLNNKVLPQ